MRSGNPLQLVFSPLHTGKILITFIGQRKPQPECNSKDDGIDTFRRHIIVVLEDSSRMYGRYLGYNTDNPNDTFTIRIGKNKNGAGFPSLFNLPNGCMIEDWNNPGNKEAVNIQVSLAYRGYYSIDQISGFNPFCGIVHHSSGKLSQNNQTITINYSSFHDSDTHEGRRVKKTKPDEEYLIHNIIGLY